MNVKNLFNTVALLSLSLLPRCACAQNNVSPPGPLLRATAPVFTDRERAAIVAYWNAPGRLSFGPPTDAATKGPFAVRLTAEGSFWFLAYQRAVGSSGIPPTVDAGSNSNVHQPPGPGRGDWEPWVQKRLALDKYLAQTGADSANAAVLHTPPGLPATPPPAPGPIPPTLLAAVGNPPPLANIVAPLRTTVTFDDPNDRYDYPDNVRLRERFAYYRFPRGTVAYGPDLKSMSDRDLNDLFKAAGFTDAEQRIVKAVSKLEGGFETVNTYDTGYVSIGFIQFITDRDGTGSLAEVMEREKQDHPQDYESDFRRFGVDVRTTEAPLAVNNATQSVAVVVIDPATGAELRDAPAVTRIIEDKRLTAVFQRAGRGKWFRVAQIQTAKTHYWPVSDAVRVTLADGTTASGVVSDVIKSEAGIATLFDRKVNRGSIAPFADVLQATMRNHNIKNVRDAARYEREIVAALKYREDFLQDRTLRQPR